MDDPYVVVVGLNGFRVVDATRVDDRVIRS